MEEIATLKTIISIVLSELNTLDIVVGTGP